MPDPIADASRRVQRAWAADGLAEITAGLLLFLPALFAWAKSGLDAEAPAWRWLNFAQILVVFPGIQVGIWLLPRVRNRLFGHRQGTMIPASVPAREAKAAMAMLIAVSMAALFAVIVFRNPHGIQAAVLAAGLGVAVIFFLVGRSSGLRRYWGLSGLAVAASLVIAAQGSDFETSFIRQFGFIGMVLMATGVATLVKFLHTPPRAPAAAQ